MSLTNVDFVLSFQSALLKNLPGMLLQLSRLQSMADLSQIITNLITSVPKHAHNDLDHIKLKFMKQIARSLFFNTVGTKAVLHA